ncbi:MAG: sugar phosphate isomerase/epimerase, partial [Anaerolineae bacterium]|nr:sugar phosphate isomerase/epimerase [Anaerolineae bacterium]
EHGERDLAWIGEWIDIAGQLGAKRARVIAGKAEPSEAALEKSMAGLAQLATRAESQGVRLMTENWFSLLSTPDYVRRLLRGLDKRVGLCADFGNWRGEDKYEKLAQIFHFAESCHAKCSFTSPFQPDRDDYTRCLELSRAAEFDGPYTLIYDGPEDDEWAGIGIEIDMVEPYLQ